MKNATNGSSFDGLTTLQSGHKGRNCDTRCYTHEIYESISREPTTRGEPICPANSVWIEDIKVNVHQSSSWRFLDPLEPR